MNKKCIWSVQNTPEETGRLEGVKQCVHGYIDIYKICHAIINGQTIIYIQVEYKLIVSYKWISAQVLYLFSPNIICLETSMTCVFQIFNLNHTFEYFFRKLPWCSTLMRIQYNHSFHIYCNDWLCTFISSSI